jgi:hypothetical protein
MDTKSPTKLNLPIHYCNITLTIKQSKNSPQYTQSFKSTLTFSKDNSKPLSNPLLSIAIKPHLPTAKSASVTITNITKLHLTGYTNY